MKRLAMPHLAARIFGTPLAIEPRKLEVILQAIGPRVLGGAEVLTLQAEDSGSYQVAVPAAILPTKPAGKNAPTLQVDSGVALIDVSGTLVHKSSWMDAVSGLRSYQSIADEFRAALADPNVKAILFSIDSGGGEVAGLNDLADEIYDARGQKRIVAIAADFACSAAYQIGAAAEEFYATEAAVTGSIGVVVAHLDMSAADRMAGVKVTHVHAGARKVYGNSHEPLSDDARSSIQALVDADYELFTAKVARFRGLNQAAVKATEAGVYVGAEAARLGLIDGIVTVKGLFERTVREAAQPSLFGPRRSIQASASHLADYLRWRNHEIARLRAEGGPDMPMDPEDPDDAPCPHCGKREPECNCLGDEEKGSSEMDPKDAQKLAAAEAEIAALKAELVTTRAAALAAQNAAEETRKAAVVEKHQRAGRIPPAMVATVEELAKNLNAEAMDKAIASWPVVTHPSANGSVGAPPAIPSALTPYQQLKAKAAEIAKATELSELQAFDRACRENPSLYAEHRALNTPRRAAR